MELPEEMEYDLTLATEAFSLAEKWDASRSEPDVSKLTFQATDLASFNANQKSASFPPSLQFPSHLTHPSPQSSSSKSSKFLKATMSSLLWLVPSVALQFDLSRSGASRLDNREGRPGSSGLPSFSNSAWARSRALNLTDGRLLQVIKVDKDLYLYTRFAHSRRLEDLGVQIAVEHRLGEEDEDSETEFFYDEEDDE